MLTDDERQLIHLAFYQGPAALSEGGMSLDESTVFLKRPDVVHALQELKAEFENQEAISALTKFALRRQLSRYADKALNVIREALDGPEYIKLGDAIMTDAKGVPLLSAVEPTSGQLRAAMDVLDRLNVLSDKQVASSTGLNVNVLFQQAEKSQLELSSDPKHTTEEERAMSRERVRNAIETLALRFPFIKAAAQKALTGSTKKKKKKSPVKKKQVKK